MKMPPAWWLGLVVSALMAQGPVAGDKDVQQGRQFYLGHCAHCHGPDGEGGRGINLTTGQYRLSRTDEELMHTVQAGVPGTEMPPSRLPPSDLRRVVAYLRVLGAAGASEKAQGDAAAGVAVYRRAGCANCHSVAGQGGSLGPALDSIGLRRSLKFLRDSLVNPGAYIAREFVGASATTKSGERFRGLRLNEDDYSLQLRDADERIRSLSKANLTEYQRLESSLMPSYQKLPADELENLIAYLSSLRSVQE